MIGMKLKKWLCAAFAVFLWIPHTPIYADEIEENPVSLPEFPGLISENVYIYDSQTKQVLYDQGGEQIIYPASLTKMMTAIVAMEAVGDMQKTVTITQEMLDGLVEANASVVGYYVGQDISLLDLVYGALLPSGADACNALVAISYGSLDPFLEAMNNKAKELGMVNTHFSNPTGLHDDNLYSTCQDMAILTNYCLQNETFKQVFFTKDYTDSQGNRMQATVQPYFEWRSYYLPGFLGDKTGFTDEAGHCMASYSELNGMNIILITARAMTDMYSPDHIDDAERILTWLEQSYTRTTVLNEGDWLANYTAKEVIGEMACEITAAQSMEADVKIGSEITVSTDQAESYLVKNDEQRKFVTISIQEDGQTILEDTQEFIVPKTDDFFNSILIYVRDWFR